MSINLSDIAGKVSIDDKSGSVDADNLKGDFVGNGSYNHYDLSSFSGKNISIENNSGNITVNAINTLENVQIENDYADVNSVDA